MEDKNVVNYVSIDTILRESEPLLVVSFPNYEDRTCAVIKEIQSSCGSCQSREKIDFLLFCLKNTNNNNMLLEDLKERNIELIKTTLGESCVDKIWLEYPSNFSPNALKRPIQNLLEKENSKDKKFDILFDISTTPKSILFYLCENVKEFTRSDVLGNVYFAYCLPEKYSEVPYAQDIGLIKGMFTGGALQFPPGQSIHTIIFPSRTGHEGKLLCDNLDSISRNTSYSMYFPIHKDSFITSLDIMQANQSLIDRESYLNYFYCTLDDAIKSFDELFQKEYIKIKHIVTLEADNISKLDPQTYLVAPFGSKMFLPVAYFELLYLKSAAPNVVTIEIANIKGFQYTSPYSLGFGALTCFELNRRKIADVLRENQDL